VSSYIHAVRNGYFMSIPAGRLVLGAAIAASGSMPHWLEGLDC
jgi:hypothetical protein